MSIIQQISGYRELCKPGKKQPLLCFLLFGNGQSFPTRLASSKAFWGVGDVGSISDELVYVVR